MNSPDQQSEKLDKATVRAELEATREAFHQLFLAIPDATWSKKGLDSAWTCKEEMWHIAWGMQFLLNVIKNARHGIGAPNPPKTISDPLNALYSKLRSFFASRQSIARRYDQTHAGLLAVLSTLSAEDWNKSVKIFGEIHTIEHFFQGISRHFKEHAARLWPLIEPELQNEP